MKNYSNSAKQFAVAFLAALLLLLLTALVGCEKEEEYQRLQAHWVAEDPGLSEQRYYPVHFFVWTLECAISYSTPEDRSFNYWEFTSDTTFRLTDPTNREFKYEFLGEDVLILDDTVSYIVYERWW